MADQWLFKSETYDNCNCAMNCGCQFNLPSTHGYCQSAFIGHIVEGHFNDTPLVGLNWAGLYKWPGEIKDGKWQTPDHYRRACGRSSTGRARNNYLRRGMQTIEQFFLRLRVHLLGVLRDLVPADWSRSRPGRPDRKG